MSSENGNEQKERTLRRQIGLASEPTGDHRNLAVDNLTPRSAKTIVTLAEPENSRMLNPSHKIQTNRSFVSGGPETENKIGPDLGIELAPAQNIQAAEESHVVTRSTASSSEFADPRLNYHAGSDAAGFRAVQDVGSRDGRTTKRVDNSRLVERA